MGVTFELCADMSRVFPPEGAVGVPAGRSSYLSLLSSPPLSSSAPESEWRQVRRAENPLMVPQGAEVGNGGVVAVRDR